MTTEDLQRVCAIERKAYEFPWSRGAFRDCMQARYRCLVYLKSDRIVAYIIVSFVLNECHILNVCVDPEYQGEGIGAMLLSHIDGLCREEGVDNLMLEVRTSNQRAIALYSRLGFHEVGSRKDYYLSSHGREDAVILAKTLLVSSDSKDS